MGFRQGSVGYQSIKETDCEIVRSPNYRVEPKELIDLPHVVFSRHARRRAQLYGICEEKVKDILAAVELPQGRTEIIMDMTGVKFPVKTVVRHTEDEITIITCYPVKTRKNQ